MKQKQEHTKPGKSKLHILRSLGGGCQKEEGSCSSSYYSVFQNGVRAAVQHDILI